MAADTIFSDFGAQENKICHCFHFFLHLFAMKQWDQMPWSYFYECWVLSQLKKKNPFQIKVVPQGNFNLYIFWLIIILLCIFFLSFCELYFEFSALFLFSSLPWSSGFTGIFLHFLYINPFKISNTLSAHVIIQFYQQ